MNKLENYIESLKFKAVIYDDVISENFSYDECVNYLLSKDFVEKLYSKVKANESFQVFDEQVKTNIKTIAFFIRQNIKTDRTYIISLLNRIICSLNLTPSVNSLKFYKIELLKRQGILLYKNQRFLSDNYSLDNDVLDVLRYSISADHDIVDSMLNEEEETFVNETVKKELLNDIFISTMNAVNYEFNEIYDNPTFRQRSIFVLKSIRDVAKNKSDIYKKEDALDVDKITMARATKILRRIK